MALGKRFSWAFGRLDLWIPLASSSVTIQQHPTESALTSLHDLPAQHTDV
ncbi:hypothetical protein [Desulfogranum marinum]|nr:hypothetical protein [Desulfogranum marinum]